MNDTSLNVATIVSVPFDQNTYVVNLPGRNDCLVCDPGLEPAKILKHLEAEGLTPAAILCTHGHSDHIAGNAALKDAWPDCPLVIGQGDAAKLTDPEQNLSAAFGLPIVSPPADRTVSEGDVLDLAGLQFDVLEAPGHSQGHVVFVFRQIAPIHILGGDVLFCGSIGRTDFPDGDFNQLRDAIQQKLYSLPDDTVILPGHGPVTTVGNEKRTNPFVSG